MTSRKIAIVGLGYVGLPIACALGRAGFQVLGYDIDATRIEELKQGNDRTGECSQEFLREAKLCLTTDPAQMRKSDFIVITAPTPIDEANRPDLTALKEATMTVGQNLSKGSIVVFESTVFPGVTEDICLPLLQKHSNLQLGVDFSLGYCPERMNPGDPAHNLEKVVKVVSASDPAALKVVVDVYGSICKAGVWSAPNIKTAEAAKVIENIQRDLNIALMNELSIVFQKIGLQTRDVIKAAATKWNFHQYTPGLVGGHCIGVDPYYLTYLAETLGYHPQLILAGRRINNQMAQHIEDQIILGLVKTGKIVNQSKVLILGVTFKENVPDIRNSKVRQIIAGLKKYGIEVHAGDPFVSAEAIRSNFLAEPASWPLDGTKYDAVLVAVKHKQFQEELNSKQILLHLKLPGVIFDVKWLYEPGDFPVEIIYETL